MAGTALSSPAMIQRASPGSSGTGRPPGPAMASRSPTAARSAQAEAMRHGIARALIALDPEKRGAVKRAGFLTRDARKKERKKYGQPGARKRFQYSKR